jgi:hypothetical protein
MKKILLVLLAVMFLSVWGCEKGIGEVQNSKIFRAIPKSLSEPNNYLESDSGKEKAKKQNECWGQNLAKMVGMTFMAHPNSVKIFLEEDRDFLVNLVGNKFGVLSPEKFIIKAVRMQDLRTGYLHVWTFTVRFESGKVGYLEVLPDEIQTPDKYYYRDYPSNVGSDAKMKTMFWKSEFNPYQEGKGERWKILPEFYECLHKVADACR